MAGDVYGLDFTPAGDAIAVGHVSSPYISAEVGWKSVQPAYNERPIS